MSRRARARQGAPLEPPVLLPCPRCRLGIEAGRNPDGLAWHECRERHSTAAAVQARILGRMAELADGANAKEASVLLEAVQGLQSAGGNGEPEGGADENDWLTRGGTAGPDE